MTTGIFDNSPREMRLINSVDDTDVKGEYNNVEKIRLKKQLGLLEGVAIILGIIFGSGKNLLYHRYVLLKMIRKSNLYLFLFKRFDRYFCLPERSDTRGRKRRSFFDYLGIMRTIVHDRSVMLRRIGHKYTAQRRRLCLHPWSLRCFAVIFISMGCQPNFCVSNWYFKPLPERVHVDSIIFITGLRPML